MDILKAFSAIGDGFVALLDFLGTRVAEGIKIAGYAVDAVAHIPQYLSWAPVGIASIIGIIVSIAVVYRILGWGD